MSFLRHGESIDPMRFFPLGASGLAHSQCSSASMSSSRLFLGRLLSSRACLRFAGRERFSKTKPRRTIIFQRTATTPLTPCLSPRVQSTCPLPLLSLPPGSRATPRHLHTSASHYPHQHDLLLCIQYLCVVSSSLPIRQTALRAACHKVSPVGGSESPTRLMWPSKHESLHFKPWPVPACSTPDNSSS
jgi:hypothetical protein